LIQDIRKRMKDKTIDYVLRTTWLAVQKMYNEEASEYGITMATGFTLLSVDPQNGTPSTSLGPKMGMEATSLSRILKTLEDLSLIERLPNPNDGRGVLIHLTESGLKNREEVKQNVLKFNSVIKTEVSEEKLNHFFEVSDCIMNLISNKKIF
jgi:MarR family transcriptional regulator, organic hydroperoxide resistance regulator